MIEQEICTICEQPMMLLMVPTENKGLPVYVCSTKPSKTKMACDGYAFSIANKRQ